MADESLHEIQLNGKQLVFLFMASTVVAVVIFLCGILVGRGVRAQRGELIAAGAPADPTADLATPIANVAGASPAANETLSYPDRLAAEAPPEALKETEAAGAFAPAGEKASPPPAPSSPGGQTRPSEDRTRKPAATLAEKPEKIAGPSEGAGGGAVPPGDGFTVQVAAVKGRSEADRMVQRLTGKGYPAYLTTPAAGAPGVFRVRVGKFKDRREAETMASRLEREEQFKPWITR